MKNLFLFRHGESHANARNIFTSRSIDLELTDNGIRQVEQAIPTIVQFKPEIIYSSPLIRARQTTEIIGRTLSMPITLDARLAEADVGDLEGKNEKDPANRSQFDHVLASWESGQLDIAFPMGESAKEIENRLESFLKTCIYPCKYSNILIVSHCVTLMVFLWIFFHNRKNKLSDNYLKKATGIVVEINV